MNRKDSFVFPLSALLSQLYGFIYSMLISNALVGMPLFGGALYLCGHAVTVFTTVYSRKRRRYLPGYANIWGIIMAVILLVIGALLMGIYPAGFQSPRVWVVFAAVALCLCADGMAGRIRRLRGTAAKATARTWITTGLFQIIMIAAATAVFFTNIEHKTALELTAGFALLIIIRALSACYIYMEETSDEILTEEKPGILYLPAYHSFGLISLLIVAAIELAVSAIYALLATGTDRILPAIAVGIGCTAVACEGSRLFLMRTRKPGRQDPTWLLCAGLVLCLGGIFICSRMLQGESFLLPWVYVCLALCSFGSTMCFSGLMRIDHLMPGVAEVAGQGVSGIYRQVREASWQLAQLLGDILSLIALTIFCFVNGNELPEDVHQLAARFQPLMIVPLILVMIGALISAFCFPLSARYIEKLQLFLRLKQNGEENPTLKKQLEHVVAEPYRQKWTARILLWLFRTFYHHKLVDSDHILEDDHNPLVFIGNHAEIYGPIVCNMYIPVPVRTWTISHMMDDKAKVTAYVYENTFSKKTYLPVFVRKGWARFIGWISVNVMSQLESVPVYKDSPLKLRETIRTSIEALESGDNLLIFPENPEGKYLKNGVGEFSPGFVMLAEAYWKKTGKKMRFLPLYANREAKTITFGEVVQYQPEAGFYNEQERIISETRTQIIRIAAAC